MNGLDFFFVRIIVASLLGQIEKIAADRPLETCLSEKTEVYDLFSVLRNCVITDSCHNKIIFF